MFLSEAPLVWAYFVQAVQHPNKQCLAARAAADGQQNVFWHTDDHRDALLCEPLLSALEIQDQKKKISSFYVTSWGENMIK